MKEKWSDHKWSALLRYPDSEVKDGPEDGWKKRRQAVGVDYTRTYPSRTGLWDARRVTIAALLDRLAALEDATDPALGDASAADKDLNAQHAMIAVGQLVDAVAGWAFLHHLGTGSELLPSVPPVPETASDNPAYLAAKARVDKHEYEASGLNLTRMAILPAEQIRQAIINTMVPMVRRSRYFRPVGSISAATMADAINGYIPPIMTKGGPKRGASVAVRYLSLKLEALGFVEYRRALWGNELKARTFVANAYGTSPENIRSWARRFKKEGGAIGPLDLLRLAASAKLAAEAVMAWENGRDEAAKWEAISAKRQYGDDALTAAAAAFNAKPRP